MAKNNIESMSEVGSIIRQYYFEPEEVMKKVEGGKEKRVKNH